MRKCADTVPYRSRGHGQSCYSALGLPVVFCPPVYQNPLCSGAADYLLLHSHPQTTPAKRLNALWYSVTDNMANYSQYSIE